MKNHLFSLILLSLIVIFNGCKKDSKDDSSSSNTTPTPTNTVTDIDGNVYHTVTIGTQVWMVENLKTTKYRDGSSIPYVTNATWSSLTTGAYRDCNNNSANNSSYGKLYNWYAVSDSRNIAPTGWHVPSDAEFTTLAIYLGGIGVAGGKLKASANETPAWDGSDSSGFKAVPAGYSFSTYNQFGSICYLWSTTEAGSTSAWYLGLGTGNTSTFKLSDLKTGGFSVRCVKD